VIRSIAIIVLLLTTIVGGSAIAQAEARDARPQLVDDQVRLTDWDYENGTFVLTFDAEVPREIVLTEAVSTQQSESGRLAVRRTTLPRGESTIRMAIDRSPSGAAALTIASRQGTQQGRAVFVSTRQPRSSSSSPFAGTSSTAGWLGGAGLAPVAVVCAGAYKLRTETTEPEVAG
jgi:hypothetical protein